MPTTTLRAQNDQVLSIEQKLGNAVVIVRRVLAKIDPNAVLVFAQAAEIERLDIRLRTIGLVLQNVEDARNAGLREFERLRSQGADVDPTVVEALRGCLVERYPEDDDSGQ